MHADRNERDVPALTAPWLAQAERGTALAMRVLVWITVKLGFRVGRALLAPICFYFIAFSRRARGASRDYLERVLDRPVRFADVFRHYHTFACTIHDRIDLLRGRYASFDVRTQGEASLHAELARGRGCILLGSHLGSFEILRARSQHDGVSPLYVLMHEGNATKINGVLQSLHPEAAQRTIALGTPSTLLRVKECLERGEMVGILGDRAIQNTRSRRCIFLERPAPFPEGPLLMAAILGVPVFLFFGLHRGGRRYDIHFELLAEKIELQPQSRAQDIAPWLQRYAQRLEHHCRQAPYNWFNFFDFWQHDE